MRLRICISSVREFAQYLCLILGIVNRRESHEIDQIHRVHLRRVHGRLVLCKFVQTGLEIHLNDSKIHLLQYLNVVCHMVENKKEIHYQKEPDRRLIMMMNSLVDHLKGHNHPQKHHAQRHQEVYHRDLGIVLEE